MKKLILVSLMLCSQCANANIVVDLENAATRQATWLDKHGYNEQTAERYITTCTTLNYYCPAGYVWCTSMSLERRWVVNIRDRVRGSVWSNWVRSARSCDR